TQAASTQLEPKVMTAEPTVIERQMVVAPPKKFSATTISAICGAIAIVIGIYLIFVRKPAQQAAAPPAPVASTAVTASAPAPANTPAGQGALLLSASPWGDIEKIVDQSNQQQIALKEDDRSTPARIDLAPGKYFVTMS